MHFHFPTFHPTDVSIAWLSEQCGIQSWCLSESFNPSRPSKCLGEPLLSLTPNLKISGKQWLIQAPSSAKISLQSGLLRYKHRRLYETNRSHPASSSQRFSPGPQPPGWWHRSRSPRRFVHPLVYLTTHNNPNYFHWFTQPGTAPLFLQEHFGLNLLPRTTLALSHRPGRTLPSYVPSLLEILAPALPISSGLAMTTDSLCRFSLQEHFSEVVLSPAQLHWLHRRCRDQLKLSVKPWRRVLISRKRSRRRRCLNEDQLLSALAPYRFERHCLEDLSVTQQLRLFSESALLVGPHGAGFSNLVACAPQAAVVEFIPRPGAFTHYYVMSDVLGLTHGHLVASMCDSQTDDFVIPPSDLIELLREMDLL